jgi:Domain of unknown function (DUF2019)
MGMLTKVSWPSNFERKVLSQHTAVARTDVKFMTRDQLSTADTMRLVEVYRDAAKQHGEATEAGDHKTANRSADLISEVYAELRQRGADAQRALLPLLTDPASGVRLWSASHALEFAPEEGEAVLKKLASGGTFLGMTAKMTLEECRAGRLYFR